MNIRGSSFPLKSSALWGCDFVMLLLTELCFKEENSSALEVAVTLSAINFVSSLLNP